MTNIFLTICFIVFSACENNNDYPYTSQTPPKRSFDTPKQREIEPIKQEQDPNQKQLTFANYDAAAKVKINQEDKKVKSTWYTQKNYEELTLLETQDFLISYNNRWGVMSVCSTDLLMVDLDYKDEAVSNKNNAIELIKQYAEKYDLTFALRESDRGMHAFLVSKPFDPIKEESQQIMCELYGDRRYISYSKIRGYCSRIGPKVFNTQRVGPGRALLDEQQMANEFVSQKPVDEIIGNKNKIDNNLLKKLYVNDDLVKKLRQEFKNNYSNMTSATVNGKTGLIPKNLLLNLKNDFKIIISNNNYPLVGTYRFDKGKPIN